MTKLGTYSIRAGGNDALRHRKHGLNKQSLQYLDGPMFPSEQEPAAFRGRQPPDDSNKRDTDTPRS